MIDTKKFIFTENPWDISTSIFKNQKKHKMCKQGVLATSSVWVAVSEVSYGLITPLNFLLVSTSQSPKCLIRLYVWVNESW